MTAIQYFVYLYRFHRPVHGRVKAFLMAFQAFKPEPF